MQYDPLGPYLDGGAYDQRRAVVKHKGDKVLKRFILFHAIYREDTDNLFLAPPKSHDYSVRIMRQFPRMVGLRLRREHKERVQRNLELLEGRTRPTDGGNQIQEYRGGWCRLRGGSYWYLVDRFYRRSGTQYYCLRLRGGRGSFTVSERKLAEIRRHRPKDSRRTFYGRKRDRVDFSGKHAKNCPCKRCRKPGVSYGSGDLLPAKAK